MYLESQIGQTFSYEVNKAKEQIQKVKEDFSHYNGGDDKSVIFEFNGAYVLVQTDTNEDWLWSQYELASLLDIKSVGFFDIETTIADFDEKVRVAEEASVRLQEKYADEYSNKVAKARETGNKAIELYPSLDLIYKSELQNYLDWKANNEDGYGGAVFDMVECIMSVANLLCAENNTHIKAVLKEAESVADYYVGGASGFQMSCVKQILRKYWVYRELV